MKKIFKLFIFVLLGLFFSFSCTKDTHATHLSFEEAKTIKEYIAKRGTDNLRYVMLALIIDHYHYYLYEYGWDDLEARGKKLLEENISLKAQMEFLFADTLEYKITKELYEYLKDKFSYDFSESEKVYFDGFGAYMPMNALNVEKFNGFAVDVGYLFGAKNVNSTSRPLEGGYEYDSRGDLLINNVKVELRGKNLKSALSVGIVEKYHNSIIRELPLISSIGSYTYGYSNISGVSEPYNYIRLEKSTNINSLINIRELTEMNITITIGDMSRTVFGTGSLPDNLVGSSGRFDPDKDIKDILYEDRQEGNKEEDEEGESGSWWDWLTKIWDWITNVLSGFLDSVLSFFDWVKEFFIPDFSGVKESIDNLRTTFSSKFSSAFSFIDSFKSAFSNAKSLHDFSITYQGNTVYPFPRSSFGELFKNTRLVLNGALLLLTLIRCYKRVVGEGDILE